MNIWCETVLSVTRPEARPHRMGLPDQRNVEREGLYWKIPSRMMILLHR
jgi:hypothetical protein